MKKWWLVVVIMISCMPLHIKSGGNIQCYAIDTDITPTSTEDESSSDNLNSDVTLSTQATQYTTVTKVALVTALDPAGESACSDIASYFQQKGIETYFENWRDITRQELLDYLNNDFDNSYTTQTQDDSGLQADFSYKPVSPIIGETVYFFDQSQGENIISWKWVFTKIDNYASSLSNNFITSWILFTRNPTTQFDVPGYYSVTLTITNASGEEDSCCKIIYVSDSVTETYASSIINRNIEPIEPNNSSDSQQGS